MLKLLKRRSEIPQEPTIPMPREIPFRAFPKIPRLNRDCIITEKLDGTNAHFVIDENDRLVAVGSRTRWITPATDNYGFAKWCQEHADELAQLGPGHYYGEWWGQGINRGYGLDEKRFSLFNPYTHNVPDCISVVPIISENTFRALDINAALLKLKKRGSLAVPGYMEPEGIVVYHTSAKQMFKVTLENDEHPKDVIKRHLIS